MHTFRFLLPEILKQSASDTASSLPSLLYLSSLLLFFRLVVVSRSDEERSLRSLKMKECRFSRPPDGDRSQSRALIAVYGASITAALATTLL